MGMPDWVKHTIGGSLILGATSYFLDNYLHKNEKISEEQKKKITGATLGAVAGGSAGYYIGEKVIDGEIPDMRKKRMVGSLAGAAGGGIVGYLIGRKACEHKIAKKHDATENQATEYQLTQPQPQD